MDPREVSEDFFDGLGEIWEGFGSPNQDYMDKIKDTQFALLLQGGTNDGGTSIINDVGVEDSAAGQSGKSPEVITQLDQMEEKVIKKSRDSDATNPSKKRGSRPLNEIEKKERKRIADEKNRNKHKEYVKKMEEELKAAKEIVKYYQREKYSLNKEYNSMAQNLHNSSNQDGEFHSEIKRLNEVIGNQQQQLDFIIRKQLLQVEVGKTDEESQSLKTENCELRRMNQSLIVERDTMKNNWQTATTIIKQLLSQISSFDGIFTQQQQLVDLYSSGLAEGREQQQKIQEWMRGTEESLNDCAEKEKANG